MENIIQHISNLISRVAEIDVSSIEPDARFREAYQIDSMTTISLVMEIESDFGIVLEVQELAGLQSVRDFAALVQKKVQARE